MESKIKKIVVGKNGNTVVIDLTNPEIPDVKEPRSKCTNIDSIFVIPEDCEVIVTEKDGVRKLNAKTGQILIVFYHESAKYKAILIDSAEWIENINAYDELMTNMSISTGSKCCNCQDSPF